MALEPQVMRAVEQLDYRVTVGDVASQAGLDINTAERGLLALASDAGGHLQVAESGEVAYLFPKNFRGILRNKYWRIRVQEAWARIWAVLFYLIRVSFGILLIVSILVITIAIIVLVIAISRGEGDNNGGGGGGGRGRSGGGFIFFPRIWFGPDIFWIFSPNYNQRSSYQTNRGQQSGRSPDDNKMNFLESVFSFLFGDGDPNADLDERRWQAIATVIRNNNGAIAAEQIAPYLDDLGNRTSQDMEDYMLPVLTRFNGRPEVSPEGQIIYHFPELQVMAQERRSQSVPAYLKESLWKFSNADSGQLTMAGGLGVLNFVLAIVLLVMLNGEGADVLGEFFVQIVFPFLLAYGTAFLGIPAIRWFWISRRNKTIEDRNQQRQQRAIALNQAGDDLQQKLTYAQQFTAQTVVSADDLAYTTEEDLLDQNIKNKEKLDAEWQRRLESGSSDT